MYPGQPVADLETYMNSLEKKQQGIQKMINKLSSSKEDQSKKPFD